MIKKISLIILVAFYLFAGINHFINPAFYYPLIPSYLPFPIFINYFSGIAEICLAFGVLFSKTRKLSSMLLISMLIAFVPSHIYFIQIGSCAEKSLCVAPWIAWIRLILIHPLLILWARYHRS